jgi:CheY-like chemotaxis protein
MSLSGPIVVIEDDPDDQEMITRAFSKLKIQNEIKVFSSGEDALAYIKSTKDKPFLIICDINMPVMNGLEVKEKLNSDHKSRMKSIPFIFLSTASNPQEIQKAYELNAQGYFMKGQSLESLQKAVKDIVDYWQVCMHPNFL